MTAAVTDSNEPGFGMRIVAQLSDDRGADQIEGNGQNRLG